MGSTHCIMDMLRFSTQCKVRQCSQCPGDTEFYCNTCKHDLCLQCKERHVIDLDTIYHDVVIYCEKYEYIPRQETCVRHPGRICKKYCFSCGCYVCVKCIGHRKHAILDIKTLCESYEAERRRVRGIIHNIRSETLYNSCFLLSRIKTDIQICHTEISNCQSEMSTKAQRLKNLIDTVIDTVIYDVKIRYTSYMMHRLQQQKRKMNVHLRYMEKCENRSEQSENRPVKFLLFLKKTHVPKIKDTPNLTQHALLSLTEEINMEDVIKLLSEIQILETGKRQLVRNEWQLKLMSTPVLHRCVKVTGFSGVWHISCVNSDSAWISDDNNLILINGEGMVLLHLPDLDKSFYGGAHTVKDRSDLIFIDRDFSISNLRFLRFSTLIQKAEQWKPLCVYCSPSNGDLLVGVYNIDKDTAAITRYNNAGQHIETIQNNSTGQTLYSRPIFIAENHNGDVIVSDYGRVVVTEPGGRHRFSYTGPPSGSQLSPRGICRDGLSNILVCDNNTNTIQMIDKDGHFLSFLLTRQQGIQDPFSVGYDDENQLLWVGSYFSNIVFVYRYINRKNNLTGAQSMQSYKSQTNPIMLPCPYMPCINNTNTEYFKPALQILPLP